jgi:hypothetical protein
MEMILIIIVYTLVHEWVGCVPLNINNQMQPPIFTLLFYYYSFACCGYFLLFCRKYRNQPTVKKSLIESTVDVTLKQNSEIVVICSHQEECRIGFVISFSRLLRYDEYI